MLGWKGIGEHPLVPVESILHGGFRLSRRHGNPTDGTRTVARATIRNRMRGAGLPGAVVAAAAVGLAIGAAAARPSVTMRGSPASMERQHAVAVEEDFTFAGSPAEVAELVAKERLVRIPGGVDYSLHQVSFPFARPEIRTFVENVAAEYRRGCGEPLVVTSLTRPRNEQPGNAHALSVHPAGMAVDFRISKSSKCQRWFEKALLALEERGLLDATRERNPPHYHVAVFPEAYRAYTARAKAAARPSSSPTVLRPRSMPAPSTAPARPAEGAPAPDPLEAPQTGGAVVAAGIIGLLALFFVWMRRRTKRML